MKISFAFVEKFLRKSHWKWDLCARTNILTPIHLHSNQKKVFEHCLFNWVGKTVLCNPLHYYLEMSQGLLEGFTTQEKIQLIPGRTWAFFYQDLKYASSSEATKMKSNHFSGTNGYMSESYTAWTHASTARVQLGVRTVWLFGAVWAFTHMAALLRTCAKLIAYVGRVWQEFSEYVFLKCTHTQTLAHQKNGLCLSDMFLASIHTHLW